MSPTTSPFIFFDLGDVFVDVTAVLREAVASAEERLKRICGDSTEGIGEAYLRLDGRSSWPHISHLYAERSLAVDAAGEIGAHRAVGEVFYGIVSAEARARVVPGPATEVVRSVVERYPGVALGVVSDGALADQLDLVARVGAWPLVRPDLVVVSEAVGATKATPALHHEALRRAGCVPERALFVGDSVERDVEPSLAVGSGALRVRFFTTAKSYATPTPSGTPEVSDAAQLENHLAAWIDSAGEVVQ